jgi:PPK2 family polyphosphate:nucleotide phosphotransferase
MAHPTRIKPGTRVSLKDYDPGECFGLTKEAVQATGRLQAAHEALAQLQARLYAESKQALLIVLQAMDAGGKDGTIRNVMRGVNPQGCSVVSFKAPTAEELAHDFLWRIHSRAPAKGLITVFNRSHYEDVLIVRVRKLVPKSVWQARYEQISAFECLLAQSGVRLLKLYLHISKEEQRERLEARLRDPRKRWKFNPADLEERASWDAYMSAYEEALTRCSSECAPWHVIPADRKWCRDVIVAELVVETLRDMNPKWPKPTFDPESITVV